MSQLNVQIEDQELEALRRFANGLHTPVDCLIRDYISYLVAGGAPVAASSAQPPSAAELAVLADRGGSFDWLADEPDLYSLDDGEPV